MKGCGRIFRIEGFGLACGEEVGGDLFLCNKCREPTAQNNTAFTDISKLNIKDTAQDE